MQPSSPQQSEAALHAVDYWQVIKNRYGIILLTLLLVFMTAAVITYVMPKKYESFATMEVKPRGQLISPINPAFSQGAGAAMMTPRFFETEFEKIKSRNVLSKVVDSLDLSNRWGVDKESALQILRGIVKTQNIRGTDLISISVTHQNREDAKDIATEVARAYKEYRMEVEGGVTERALHELKAAVRDQEDQVEERRKVVTSIAEQKGIVDSADSMSFTQRGIDEYSSVRSAYDSYDTLEQQKIELQSQIKNLLNYNEDQLLNYASALNLPDNIIKSLYPQYLELKRQVEGLKSNGLGDLHPTIISQEKVLSEMKLQLDEGVLSLRESLQAELDLANAKLAQVGNLKNDRKEEAIQRSLDRQAYEDAKRAYNTDQELLQSMKEKLLGETISNSLTEELTEIHDQPVLARAPVSPNVTLNLALGAVVGLIFGVGIAFFLEYMDTSVKSMEDVERYLQVPVLAVIPKDVGVLHKQSGMSPDAEAYRILRTNIEFNRKNPEDNSITVVSGGAGEGKSTTLVNLAYICAQGGYTTLMIDGDLRRPRLHTFFDINNSVGLTNFLTTELALEDVILQTPVDNLYFMPSGILPSDAAGILNSRRMSELIQDVKQRFDLVLVDSPPILGVSDASVLASEVDLTMIVVQHRKLPRNMLMRVKQAVENVGGNVIGVVLNNVDVRSDSQYQYYTSYYTYYAPAEAQVGPPTGSGKASDSKAKVSSNTNTDSELY
ncbi:polysaccharide biosynthesis tyrosine autokinase [Luteolibacter pohnpeiensis]|uniref:Polysaccharide biosynthesis tyrosine autokinase n=1 Tax=Luteolibacter pohnpeiensis TaxID=454153 RepID=A0A934S3F4_9BACT|nr:polysaccharide biosynthesis tyrosine autokinase [Luteolibacter pohnpeiensis]MBK1881597.1 polysaccharide biosynthesis tyrosine autokinase [Luteolibacter pohnpeiensis]